MGVISRNCPRTPDKDVPSIYVCSSSAVNNCRSPGELARRSILRDGAEGSANWDRFSISSDWNATNVCRMATQPDASSCRRLRPAELLTGDG